MKCSALKKVCEKLEHLVTTNEYTCHILVEWLDIVLPVSKCTGSQPCFPDALTDCPISFSLQVPSHSEDALTELPDTVLA